MTEKLKFTRAQMRNAAIVAKEEGVSITLAPDGSMSVLPFLPAGSIKFFYRVGKGERMRLPDDVTSNEFKEAYRLATIGQKPLAPKTNNTPVQSLKWIVERYRESAVWKAFSPATQRQRENIFIGAIKRSGNADFRSINKKAIMLALESRSDTPAQANHFLKAMRGLFAWALKNDHVGLDPTAGVEQLRYKTDGFAAWSMDDLIRFYERWPIGSKARLAVELIIHTGLRRSDIVNAGWQHMRGNIFSMKTQKTGAQITVEFPESLLNIIKETETGDMTFLISEFGTPFGTASFGNWFRDRCNDAIIKKSAHGIRKLSATLAAEAGAATHELMAQYGWSNVKQAELYTKGADRVKLGIKSSR